jgi:hypothetical protein
MSEGEFAYAANLMHEEGRGPVVKKIDFVVAVVCRPENADPFQFRYQLICRHCVTDRLHLPVFQLIIH